MRIITFLIILLSLVGCEKTEKREIIISAAASLSEGIEEVAKNYEKETGVKVIVNIGASGILRKQVEQGAPVDFIFLASTTHLNILVDEKLVKDPKNILKNSLVVIGNKKIKSLKSLVDSKVAIGDPNFVPAGRYAKESLISKKVWKELKSNLILTKDVRSALTYVQRDEVDFSIVYSTDSALIEGKEVYEIDEESHTPIVYSAGIVNGTKEGGKFYKYLLKNREIFKKYGFKVD